MSRLVRGMIEGPNSRLLSQLPSSICLYIHVPFCSHFCPYCAFSKATWREDLELAYVTALCEELSGFERLGLGVKTVFFGGGTPSMLSPASILAIMGQVRRCFDDSELTEITFEANPESVSRPFLDAVSEAGVHRLSLGVQSFVPEELSVLGRVHSVDTVLEALALLGQYPALAINIDLMFGIQGASIKAIQYSLDQLASYDPGHVSVYGLSIEPNTVFAQRSEPVASEQVSFEIYERVIQVLTGAGYRHYEVSAFAKPGQECRHNLAYWHFDSFLGVGPSADSFLLGARFSQCSSLKTYLKDPTSPFFLTPLTPLSDTHYRTEYLLANLRVLEGFSLDQYQHRFGHSLQDDYPHVSDRLVLEGLIEYDSRRLRFTKKGIYLHNEVLMAFIEA
ncbi:MAG: hypothetical protein CL521_05050 [Actinobacteria bacterium]|nr:hypothetical protein [Actinomycetota bacterium]